MTYRTFLAETTQLPYHYGPISSSFHARFLKPQDAREFSEQRGWKINSTISRKPKCKRVINSKVFSGREFTARRKLSADRPGIHRTLKSVPLLIEPSTPSHGSIRYRRQSSSFLDCRSVRDTDANFVRNDSGQGTTATTQQGFHEVSPGSSR
jgi:hypothetical protein